MDCSPPGSSVHGILQARILEWVAISFSISFQSSILLSKTCMKALSPLGMQLHWGWHQHKKEQEEERLPSPNQLWRQEPGDWRLPAGLRTRPCYFLLEDFKLPAGHPENTFFCVIIMGYKPLNCILLQVNFITCIISQQSYLSIMKLKDRWAN